MPRANTARPIRCFIGFFGITRALDSTIGSIEANVFAPLERAGIVTVRAAHLNRPVTLDAPRSGERGVPFALGDLSRLRLDRVEIEPQSPDSIAGPLAQALRIPLIHDPDPDGATRRNAVYQLHSLRGLGRLMQELGPETFDFAMLLRPDLRYLDPVPVCQIMAQLGVAGTPGLDALRRKFRPVADLVTPFWHRWGGLNDRFAFATPDAARAYLNRIDHLGAFCLSQPAFQTETLLGFAMARDGVRNATTWMRAERIRSDGSVAARDRPWRRDRWRQAITYPLHRAFQI